MENKMEFVGQVRTRISGGALDGDVRIGNSNFGLHKRLLAYEGNTVNVTIEVIDSCSVNVSGKIELIGQAFSRISGGDLEGDVKFGNSHVTLLKRILAFEGTEVKIMVEVIK